MTLLSSLRTKLVAEHYSQPQVVARINSAIEELANGLTTLASLGHQFHLEPGPASPGDKWPKLMFHVSSAPNGRVVNSEWDLTDLGNGWFETLETAQHANGVQVQFAGRAGQGHANVPMVVNLPESANSEDTRRQEIIDQWKRSQSNG